MTVSFAVYSNIGEYQPVFEAAIVGLRDMRTKPMTETGQGPSLWDLIYATMRLTRLRLANSQGASEGLVWPDYQAHEERYRKIKEKILKRSVGRSDLLRWMIGVKERLVPSYTRPMHPDGIGWQSSSRAPLALTYGSAVPYAGNHERGVGQLPLWARMENMSHAIPARPMLTIGAETTRRLEQDTIKYASLFTAEIGLRGREVAAMPLRRIA